MSAVRLLQQNLQQNGCPLASDASMDPPDMAETSAPQIKAVHVHLKSTCWS